MEVALLSQIPASASICGRSSHVALAAVCMSRARSWDSGRDVWVTGAGQRHVTNPHIHAPPCSSRQRRAKCAVGTAFSFATAYGVGCGWWGGPRTCSNRVRIIHASYSSICASRASAIWASRCRSFMRVSCIKIDVTAFDGLSLARFTVSQD